MPARNIFSGQATPLPPLPPVPFAMARAGSRSATRLAGVLAFALVLGGCYDQPTEPVAESDDRAIVTSDEGALADRVRYPEEDVPVDAPVPNAFAAALVDGPALAPSAIELVLRTEIDVPDVNGLLPQATSISRRGNNSFLVSYNVRGDVFLGGIDYVANLLGRYPLVLSSVILLDSDVSAVALDGSTLYAAQATDASGFATPAAVERLSFTFFGISLQQGMRADLSSFAATSVTPVGNVVYVTTGDDGHLYALDAADFSVLGQYPLDDARWVEYDEEGGRIVVVQGTPGRISIFEEGSFPGGSMQLLNTFPFPGADVPESKSAMDIAGGKAFIAAGPEGVQIMCLDNGDIVGSVPRPDPAALVLDPDVVVTNAVTADEDLMFISNGEAGVYAAAGEDAWADTACDAPQDISVLGRLRFSALQSANHVDYRNKVLAVAAGLGGVKIVRVSIRN